MGWGLGPGRDPGSGPDADALDVIDDGDIHHVPDSPKSMLVASMLNLANPSKSGLGIPGKISVVSCYERNPVTSTK